MFFKAKSHRLRSLQKLLSEHRLRHDDIGDLSSIEKTDHFIISMPKVATTTIQRGLEQLGRKALHAHTDQSTWAAFEDHYVMRNSGIDLRSLIELRKRSNSRRLYFYFGYREPVSWFLSLGAFGQVSLDDSLITHFEDKFFRQEPWCKYTTGEPRFIIADATGLDPIVIPNGSPFAVQHKKRCTVISYRLDHFDKVSAFIMQNVDARFVNSPHRVNDSTDYAAYRSKFRLPEEKLRRLYDTEVHRAFYTARETEKLIAKWSN